MTDLDIYVLQDGGAVAGDAFLVDDFFLSVSGAGPTPTPAPTPTPVAGGSALYNANSIWNKPIGANPTLHPDSAAIVAILSSYVTKIAGPSSDSAPIERITDPNEPTADVYLGGTPYITAVPGASTVRMTYHAVPNDFTDGQMIILDIPHTRSYSFYRFDNHLSPITTVTAGWEGIGSDADGIHVFSDSGNGWGGRATGWSYLAGKITRDEIIAGVISHAIAWASARGDMHQTLYDWPAFGTDGYSVSSPFREGMHLQLNPAVDVNALSMSAGGKAICRALQTYGAWVADVLGDSIPPAPNEVQLQTEAFYTGTYPNVTIDPSPWSGLLAENDLANLPLDQMRVLAVNQGDYYQNTNPPSAVTPTPVAVAPRTTDVMGTNTSTSIIGQISQVVNQLLDFLKGLIGSAR
ncbi:MAG: hypothetical protein Q8P89_04030 [bacterium]|nr:hypothetical protein [bacterium]